MSSFFFSFFTYGLKYRVDISNYETCTTAVETLQQNTSKGPSTVPRCTAQLLIYFSESLQRAKKTKNNKHLGKKLSLSNKKKIIPNLKYFCSLWEGADTLLTSAK